MLERIRQDHAALLQLATQVRLILQGEGAIDLAALASVRWQLARVLGSHLAYLGAFVFGPLLKTTSGRRRQDIQELANRTDALTATYRNHRTTFEAATIEKDGEGYRRQTTALLDGLTRLILDEERILYPAMTVLGGAKSAYADQFEGCATGGW